MVREREIPLKIEVFSNGEDSDYLVYSETDILRILQTISARNTRVALYYDEGNRFVLTMLLAANEDGLWIDPAPNQLDNAHILESNKLVFVSTHNRAKVQFISTEAHQVVYENNEAIFLPFPLKIVRLQRRDYYRLVAWPRFPLYCVVKPIREQEQIKHNMTVMDISVGGVALVCLQQGIELTPGKLYPDCEIELPGVGKVGATIQVKNIFEVTARNGDIRRRAGCVFVEPDMKTTMMLQKYVTLMQRQEATVSVAQE